MSDQFTFYRINAFKNMNPTEVAEDLINCGRMIEAIPSDEYENEFGTVMALKFSEVIEDTLMKGEYARCVISTMGTAPDEVEMLNNFDIVLCQSPYLAMKVWPGIDAVGQILDYMKKIADLPFYAEKNQSLSEIVKLIRSSLESEKTSGGCAIVAILRSYYI